MQGLSDSPCQVLQYIDRPSPVSLHHAVSECGGRGLVQPAARLLHQDVRTGPETHVTEVLAYQSHHLNTPTSALSLQQSPSYLLVRLGQLCTLLYFPQEIWINTRVGGGELSLSLTLILGLSASPAWRGAARGRRVPLASLDLHCSFIWSVSRRTSWFTPSIFVDHNSRD